MTIMLEAKIRGDNKEEQNNGKDSMEILEDALVICGFGKYHIILLFVLFLASSPIVLINTTTTFILPVAECDLEMDNTQKGLLITIPSLGLTVSVMVVGFLTDTFGRKQFILYGLIASFLLRIIQGASQNFATFVIAKFVEGFFTSFCYPGPLVILSEMIHKNIKERVLLITTTFFPIHVILTALVSWAILPLKLDFMIGDYFAIHSWNIYLYVCSLWSLLAAIGCYFIPESPKYLLTHGKEDEALEVLKQIYSVNTGKDKDSFPIKTLKVAGEERAHITVNKNSIKKRIVNTLFDMKFLFKRPLFQRLVSMSLVVGIALSVHNSLKGWYAQLVAIVENYTRVHNRTEEFCTVITDYTESLLNTINQHDSNTPTNLTLNGPEVCTPHISGANTYISGVLLGLISLTGAGISTFLLKVLDLRTIIFIIFLSCSSFTIAIYWTTTATELGMLLCATCGLLQMCFNLLMNLTVRSFPTTVRSVAMATILTTGRLAAVLGGILLPDMLNVGCMVPFIVIAVSIMCIACLVYCMPSPKSNESDQ